ncbi:hypothetical protein TM48_03172 [Mycobacterium shottsii]|nr:hypothetical protein TM48_03172 [Mycobacterium shottsii]
MSASGSVTLIHKERTRTDMNTALACAGGSIVSATRPFPDPLTNHRPPAARIVDPRREHPGIGERGTLDRRYGNVGGERPTHPHVQVACLDPNRAVFGSQAQRHRKGQKPPFEPQLRFHRKTIPAPPARLRTISETRLADDFVACYGDTLGPLR